MQVVGTKEGCKTDKKSDLCLDKINSFGQAILWHDPFLTACNTMLNGPEIMASSSATHWVKLDPLAC